MNVQRCPICESDIIPRPTPIELAGGTILGCPTCGGYFLSPPVHVDYTDSSWTEKRQGQFAADVERGRRFAPRIAEWFRQETGRALGSILEIGCGSGYLGPAFEGLGVRYTGTEVDESLLAFARRNGVNAHPIPAETMAEADVLRGGFDLVLSSNVFEHVVSPPAAFGALAALSFERAVVIVPNAEGFLPRVKAWRPLRLALNRVARRSDNAHTIDGHWHNIAYSRQSLGLLAGKAGLVVEELRTIGINDPTFGFVQPNPSLAYRAASACLTYLDVESQLILRLRGAGAHAASARRAVA